jgi:hypothetical protein
MATARGELPFRASRRRREEGGSGKDAAARRSRGRLRGPQASGAGSSTSSRRCSRALSNTTLSFFRTRSKSSSGTFSRRAASASKPSRSVKRGDPEGSSDFQRETVRTTSQRTSRSVLVGRVTNGRPERARRAISRAHTGVRSLRTASGSSWCRAGGVAAPPAIFVVIASLWRPLSSRPTGRAWPSTGHRTTSRVCRRRGLRGPGTSEEGLRGNPCG